MYFAGKLVYLIVRASNQLAVMQFRLLDFVWEIDIYNVKFAV